jgi:hypothetical protein
MIQDELLSVRIRLYRSIFGLLPLKKTFARQPGFGGNNPELNPKIMAATSQLSQPDNGLAL